ncbi:hypothetical protein [Nonomuraea sp. NPDC049784]|uniref:hypothetical protein n=1 Tax=Nonomuraea sp. NPDC049784 TaxID=3154361 RepID=UPI0033C3FEAB
MSGSMPCATDNLVLEDQRAGSWVLFALPEAPGQMLVTYHAPAGSDTRERLDLLAHLIT